MPGYLHPGQVTGR